MDAHDSLEALIHDVDYSAQQTLLIIDRFKDSHLPNFSLTNSINLSEAKEFMNEMATIHSHIEYMSFLAQGVKNKMKSLQNMHENLAETAAHSVYLRKCLLQESRRNESLCLAISDSIAERSRLESNAEKLRRKMKHMSNEIKFLREISPNAPQWVSRDSDVSVETNHIDEEKNNSAKRSRFSPMMNPPRLESSQVNQLNSINSALVWSRNTEPFEPSTKNGAVNTCNDVASFEDIIDLTEILDDNLAHTDFADNFDINANPFDAEVYPFDG